MQFRCFFDGSFNPEGYMGYGFVIFNESGLIKEYSGWVEKGKKNSCNVAEYLALNALLEFLIEKRYTKEKIEIFGDSMLVVNQMKRMWKIKNGLYVQQAFKCRNLLIQFTNCTLRWIPREQNTLADIQSNLSLKKKLAESDKEFGDYYNDKINKQLASGLQCSFAF